MPLNLWAWLIRVSGHFYMEAHELRPMPGNSCCQGQPPARKFVRYLKEDHVRKKGDKVLDRTKALYGPRTQAYGETKYKNFHYYKFRTEPRLCMVPGPRSTVNPAARIYKKKKGRFELRNMGYLIKRSDPFIHGLDALRGQAQPRSKKGARTPQFLLA